MGKQAFLIFGVFLAISTPVEAKIFKTDAKGKFVTVYLDQLVETSEITELGKEQLQSHPGATISFRVESLDRGTWASYSDWNGSGDIVADQGFDKAEWDAFGKDGKMYPPDSEVVGVWRVRNPAGAAFDEIVSVYRWKNKTFVFEKLMDGGAGAPDEVRLVKTDNGTELHSLEPGYNWFVINHDDELETWEDGIGKLEDFTSSRLE